MNLVVGETYRAHNQGTAITPRVIEVMIVWLDGESVHYRREGESKVHQTSVDRFIEIVSPGKSLHLR